MKIEFDINGFKQAAKASKHYTKKVFYSEGPLLYGIGFIGRNDEDESENKSEELCKQ